MIEEDVDNTNHTGTEAAECAAGKREKRRKAVKKEKRKNKRKEMAEMARREEEIRLNDPEEQRRLQAEEEQERLRAEEERRHFVEMERKILEEWEKKKALQEKEEEERRRRVEQEELLSKQNQVGHENEVDDDGWEYVEEGPSEIIWQGNEIIVKKKKIRVKKKDDQQIMKEDTNRPISNPLPPQSEAFTDHKTAQQLLDSVAQETPNFGTEQDKAHCPFHLKTGACRFGSRCSRIHFYPDKSCTLLIKSMYNGPGLAWEQDEGLEHTDEEVERAYEEFYEDVHTEFLKFGEIINFKVCRNGSSHLRGNVYVHYKSLESAVLSYQSVNGRYFAGKQLHCEFVGLTRWRVAICGEFMKSKLKNCSRGTACNFIHCFRNPGGDYEWADWDKPPPKYWVKEMAALFGCPDESGHHRKIEQGSPRLISSVRSLSRKTESPSSSRNYSDDDLWRSDPRRHHRGSDRKHSEKLDNEHHADISKRSSNLSPGCRKRKLGSQCGRSDEMNIHETDLDENMHENDLDSYHYEPSRSRRHREKQCRGVGSKGDERIEDNRGPLNQSGTAKCKDPEQPKKMPASPAEQGNIRGTSTYNSDLAGDCSDGERQSRHICGEESPISHGSEEFEERKKRPCTNKLKISSNWDNSDRGNGEDAHDSEILRGSCQSYRTSDYSSKYHCRKERQRVERGKSERQIPVHREKSERKREVEYREVIRSHATDDERGRWEPEKGDSV
ncbi:zinc finger CCCH domain-containing protein 5 isoform X2 [Salvia miltiorrhiza]|uniref:zinc finger CCCH domain-containing protein 5 isoform X2 n=1 Tax=Salvia miltiorrhiza TaxID=226208 RepID=UPI0025AD269D|nr:zinc finger CCCH domain-containing protein 5 isoform X2 [Salvia miltiorrhiza]